MTNATAETEKTYRIDWVGFDKRENSFRINGFDLFDARRKAAQRFNKLKGNIVSVVLIG